MYKKIMVAVDGSDSARKAIEEALGIARTFNGNLCIVHVADSDSDAAKKIGAILLNQARSGIDALNTETRLLQAKAEYGLTGVAKAIVTAAKEWGADMLVVGTSNPHGLERFFEGTVAEHIVGKIDATILLVRPSKESIF